jgi:hypothetical protein
MKKTVSSVAALAAFTFHACSQAFTVPTAGLYNPRPTYLAGYDVGTLMPGGTCAIPALSTNTFIVYSTGVSNNLVITTNSYSAPQGINVTGNMTNLWLFNAIGYTNVAYEFGFTGTATSTNSLYIYQSQDQGRTFGLTPIFQIVNVATGAASYETNGSIYVPGGGTLAIVVTGTGTTFTTNAVLEFTTTGTPAGTLHVIQ